MRSQGSLGKLNHTGAVESVKRSGAAEATSDVVIMKIESNSAFLKTGPDRSGGNRDKDGFWIN